MLVFLVSNDYKIFYLEQMLRYDSLKTLFANLENRNVGDSCRYDYALAALDFLDYLSQDDDVPDDFLPLIQKGIVRWNRARSNYQKGLVSNRAVKKRKEILSRERGLYPKISEVSMCALYFRKKLPAVSGKTFSPDALRKFFTWLAFSLCKSNALRPSSIANMKVKEFDECITRDNLKIVCVEGMISYIVYHY